LFLVVLPLSFTDWIENASRGINNIYSIDPNYKYIVSAKPPNPLSELSLPFRREVLTDFTPYIPEPHSKCIDRSRYNFEFARLLGLHPYRDDLSKPHVLLVGDSSELGKAIFERLKKSGAKIAHCGCQQSIDWSSPDSEAIVRSVNIAKAIVVCPMVLPSFASSDGAGWARRSHLAFLNGLAQLFQNRSVPFLHVTNRLAENEQIDVVDQFGGKSIIVPNLLSSNSNLASALRQCQKTQNATVELTGRDDVTDLTVEDAATFVASVFETDFGPGTIELSGNSTSDLKKTLSSATQNCSIHYHKSTHHYKPATLASGKIQVSKSPTALSDFLNKSFSPRFQKDPYLSIVVVGRHDNWSNGFENRSQAFLDALGWSLARVPLADVELVFVDYATARKEQPLRKVLNISSSLSGRTRFIEVPPYKQSELQAKLNVDVSFFEYIARNIGIRRAKGQFILSTTPDNLLSSFLLELVAARDFNEAVLYRSVRFDGGENQSVAELYQMASEPWRPNLARHRVCSKTFSVHDSCANFSQTLCRGSPGDFLLASRRLFDAAWGFNELPLNANVDTIFLAKLMKLIPGYVSAFLPVPTVHQWHEKAAETRPRIQALDAVMDEIACVGESKTLGKNYDSYRWGELGETFAEFAL
jgi:hypothetical protein